MPDFSVDFNGGGVPSRFVCKMFPRQLGTVVMLFSQAVSAFAADDETWRPDFSFHGFGTLGAVYHDEQGVQYRRDVAQGFGAKAGQISLTPDTMLGGQITARFNDAVEATVQEVSRENMDGNFRPEMTLGFLKYSPDANLSLRAGRLIVEYFMQGDSAHVGYANLMIRQPINAIPRNFDGLDADWHYSLGEGVLRLKGFAGFATGKTRGASGSGSYNFQGSEFLAGIVEYSQNGWTGRYSGGQLIAGKGVEGIETLTAALKAAPNGAAIIDRLNFKSRAMYYQSLALAYDNGPWQALASYDWVTSENWPIKQGFFATLGYRLGSVTPYAGFVRQTMGRDIIKTGIPNGLSARTDTLNIQSALAQSGLLLINNQTDIIFGARYDFASNMALKLQMDWFQYRDPATAIDPGLFTQSFESRGTKTFPVFSAALDFVF